MVGTVQYHHLYIDKYKIKKKSIKKIWYDDYREVIILIKYIVSLLRRISHICGKSWWIYYYSPTWMCQQRLLRKKTPGDSHPKQRGGTSHGEALSHSLVLCRFLSVHGDRAVLSFSEDCGLLCCTGDCGIALQHLPLRTCSAWSSTGDGERWCSFPWCAPVYCKSNQNRLSSSAHIGVLYGLVSTTTFPSCGCSRSD